MAEAFDKEFKAFYHASDFVPELPFKLDLLGLYDIFIERKYKICLQEKGKIPKTHPSLSKKPRGNLLKTSQKVII
jgi:hypothetical protein